jgi:hypothetical protein
MKSGNRAVGIATSYGQDDQGVKSSSLGKVKNCHFSILSRPALEPTQPPPMAIGGSLPPLPGGGGWKCWGLKTTTHFQLSKAEAKKTWVYTFTPPYVFMT